MKLLSRTEEMILLAVHTLADEAYGISIRNYLRNISGRSFSIGAIYVPLERLQAQGFLLAIEGAPTAERGGRSKRFFRLSAKGQEALESLRALNQILWKDYPGSQIKAFTFSQIVN